MKPLVFFTLISLLSLPLQAGVLVVGNKVENTVSFFDSDSYQELARLKTGDGPHEVALTSDGKYAAVVAYGNRTGGRSIDIFDVTKLKRLKRIELGKHTRPHGISYMADNRHLLVTTEGSANLIKVDSIAGKLVEAIPTFQQGSHMLALAEDKNRVYVANLGNETVSVIDLSAKKVVKQLTMAIEPEGLWLTPDGQELWVANRGSDNIYVFDTDTLDKKAEIQTGNVPIRLTISADGKLAATSDYGSGQISVFDVASRKLVGSVALQVKSGPNKPITLIFHPDGRRLFVAIPSAGQVAVIDVKAMRQVTVFPAGRGADGLGLSEVTPVIEP